jgi:phosphatidylglycerophosphate synthase
VTQSVERPAIETEGWLARFATGTPPLPAIGLELAGEPVRTWANLVTVIRTLASIVLAMVGVCTDSLPLLVIGYLVYWIGDSADGTVARALKQETRYGAVFDVLSDRACTCILAVAYIAHDHGVVVPLTVFLLQFMVVDTLLTLSFLHWPLVSPNYFYRADRPIYLFNWSKTAKVTNTTAVVTLTAFGLIIPATVLAAVVLVIKCGSLRRIAGLLAGRTAAVT